MCEAIGVPLHALVYVRESFHAGQPCVFRLPVWPCALVRAYVDVMVRVRANPNQVGFALDGRQLTQHWSSRSGHERKLVPVVAVAD